VSPYHQRGGANDEVAAGRFGQRLVGMPRTLRCVTPKGAVPGRRASTAGEGMVLGTACWPTPRPGTTRSGGRTGASVEDGAREPEGVPGVRGSALASTEELTAGATCSKGE
jgi:hypothetical protein